MKWAILYHSHQCTQKQTYVCIYICIYLRYLSCAEISFVRYTNLNSLVLQQKWEFSRGSSIHVCIVHTFLAMTKSFKLDFKLINSSDQSEKLSRFGLVSNYKTFTFIHRYLHTLLHYNTHREATKIAIFNFVALFLILLSYLRSLFSIGNFFSKTRHIKGGRGSQQYWQNQNNKPIILCSFY